MRLWQRLTARRDGQPLPAEIYISLVDALFKDSRSLFVGSLAASITALITAWKTGEQALYLCSVAMRHRRLRARPRRAGLSQAASAAHRHRAGAAMGAALRRRRRRPRVADGHLVPAGLRQDLATRSCRSSASP